MVDIIYTLYLRDYERFAYFVVSVQSMKQHAIFYGVEHKYHVCVEAYSDILLKDALESYCAKEHIKIHYKDSLPSLHSMMNFVNTVGDNSYILLMQDDWQLLDNYDFSHGIEMLESYDDWGMIRYNNDNFEGAKDIGNGLWELSPECNGYYYSDNPHIKKRDYHTFTGPYRHIAGEHGAICENLMNGDAKKVGHEHKIISIRETIFKHLGVAHTVINQKEG